MASVNSPIVARTPKVIAVTTLPATTTAVIALRLPTSRINSG